MSEFKKIKLLYCGVRCDSKGGLSCIFTILDGDSKDTQMSYKKCKEFDVIPGEEYFGLYNGSQMKTKLEWIGAHPNKGVRDDHYVSDKMARSESVFIKKQAKMKKDGNSIITDSLRPLSKAYHSTNAAGRAAMIAQVITYMQREL